MNKNHHTQGGKKFSTFDTNYKQKETTRSIQTDNKMPLATISMKVALRLVIQKQTLYTIPIVNYMY